MDFKNLLVLSSFIINLFLSLLIHFRSTKTKAIISFEVTAFGITAWCLAMILYRATSYPNAVFWARLLYFFPTFIPTAFLLFGLYFPNAKVSRITILSIIGWNALLSFLALSNGAIVKDVVIQPGMERKIIFGWAYYYFYIIYIPGFFTASYIVLLIKYMKNEAYIRMQILYILLGMTMTSVPAMITNLNLPTLGYFELNWVGQLFTIFWIGGVAYAITKHRLMDIRLFVARTFAYTLLTATLGLLYSGGLFFGGNLLASRYASREELYISTILALFMAFSFQPLRRFFEKVTNNIFYKGRYNPDLLLSKLSRIMASNLILSDLAKLLVKELQTEMKIASGQLILTKEDAITWINKIPDTQENKQNAKKLTQLIDMIAASSKENILVLQELPESEEKNILREENISILLPLVVKNEVIGALLLSDKSSGDIYSSQDINVLRILASEIAVAVKNALSYEEIKNFNSTLEGKIKQATKELKNANERLKQLDELKDEFVSLASHELRTPMTIIKSYLWFLQQQKNGKLTSKQKEYVDRAYLSTERLINLVNDMLNVSRIESGRLTIEMRDINIAELIEQTVEELKTRAQELGVTLTVAKHVLLPLVHADPERIKQVLINLIGNSFKFTPKDGNITVLLSANNGMVEISVKDTGSGIDQDDMPKLFQKFNILGDDYLHKQSTQGTGLGLYISKSIIELHEGKIWVESAGSGRGATFTFTLKVADVNTKKTKTSQEKLLPL